MAELLNPDSITFPKRRLLLALAVAIVADLASLPEAMSPLFSVLLDFVWLGVLVLILGARWELFLALLPEAIPGISLFPTWTAVVVWLAAKKRFLNKKP